MVAAYTGWVDKRNELKKGVIFGDNISTSTAKSYIDVLDNSRIYTASATTMEETLGDGN